MSKYTEMSPEEKDKMRKYLKEKITCKLCGSTVSRVHMKRHQSTKKCDLLTKLKEFENK